MSATVTAIAMWVLLYAPTPYLVYEPGIAVPVEPMITVQGDGDSGGDKGQFMLTAVKLTAPNMWRVVRAGFDSDRDVFLKRDVFRGESQKQYAERLTVIMEGSQNDAVEAAYRYLQIPYKVETDAILISDVNKIDGQRVSPFHSGDRLLGLSGGERFHSVDDAIVKLKSAWDGKDGSSLSFDVERQDKKLSLKILMTDAAQGEWTTKYFAQLLGVTGFTELRAIKSNDKNQQLTIAAGEIGGPSAGLVFTLQAIDLLSEGDLTGGAQIAATGTIDVEGKIGAIGGIKQKVVITSQQGAELFLVPKQNEKAARAKAKAMGTKMDIVAVETLQDAINAISAHHSNG
ncbi:PDZ domain-containing protein [Paenibacillus sp. L3-i20]|nr:PDZ domain-containing protein [Paenibacillus sp. L3-i20]